MKVRLEVEKTELEFKFSEDNHQMFTSENLRIVNPGNAPASYEFRIGRNSLFEFNPRVGSIPGFSEGMVKITYTPLGKLQKAQDKEKVIL